MRGSEFAELRAFAAVVEQCSFARAAERLGRSPSALSQTIRQLERRLGVRLLDRTTRSVAPTPVGARLNERLVPMLRELDAAVAEAAGRQAQPAGPLRIGASRFAASTLITPRLARFREACPNVPLEIVVTEESADIAAGLDAVIRPCAKADGDLVAMRLTPDMEMLAVAAPAYLARRGVPAAPADLHRHACICAREPGGEWPRWAFAKGGKRLEIAVEGALISSDRNLAIQGALQGLGILYTHGGQLLRHLLAQGRLRRVLADWSPPFPGLFLHRDGRRPPSPALAAFIDCLLDRALREAD